MNRWEHITDTLVSLHWLPIHERVEYKILLLVFKALHGLAPGYLSDLLNVYVPTRNLRSMHSFTLVVPKTRLKYYGDRAFCHCGPVLWNGLPHVLRSEPDINVFKGMLKTFLFKRAYSL